MDKQIVEKLYCDECNQTFKAKCNLFLHYRIKHKYSKEQIQELRFILSNITTISEMKGIETRKNTNIQKFGSTSPFNSEIIKEKIKAINLQKYGTIFPAQNKDIINKQQQTKIKNNTTSGSEKVLEKARNTWLKNYGTDNPSKCKEVLDKRIKTNQEKYGTDWGLSNREIIDKGIKTCIEKYGDVRSACSDEVKEKMRKTNEERYGCWYAQTEEHQCKNWRYKEYTTPSGKKIKIQGYENIALDELYKTYKEEDILTELKDIRQYIGKLIYYDKNNKKHRYFPDFYIKSENMIVEVKSTYTFNVAKEINLLKQKCCLDAGFKYRFIVYE